MMRWWRGGGLDESLSMTVCYTLLCLYIIDLDLVRFSSVFALFAQYMTIIL